jgi:16S rRNA processing protein RimM
LIDAMTNRTDGLLEIGSIGRPHGLHGEVYVDLVTDRTERLDVGSSLLVNTTWLTVVRAKPHGQRWLVMFDGITDRVSAERLTSGRLYAEPIDDPDALWVHDLVGATVRTESGTEVGRCVGVVANPASDLLELDDGTLVPERFVTGAVGGVITIDPPEGLLELPTGDTSRDDTSRAADHDHDQP